MAKINGIIERVKDNGPTKGKFGTQYRISLSVEDEWYSGFFSKSADRLNIEEGNTCTFSYSVNGEYKNIDTKTFKVTGAAEDSQGEDDDDAAAAPSLKPTAKTYVTSPSILGQIKGNALTNGVQMAIASGKLDAEAVFNFSMLVLAVSAKLDKVVERVLASPEQTISYLSGLSEEKQPEPVPTHGPKPVAAASKPKAAPPPKPEPVVDPDPISPEHPFEGFSDDLPF
jgi:hypothetical protein